MICGLKVVSHNSLFIFIFLFTNPFVSFSISGPDAKSGSVAGRVRAAQC